MLRITLAQLNYTVGDIAGNVERLHNSPEAPRSASAHYLGIHGVVDAGPGAIRRTAAC
ncbi:MAG: hypothetical protein RR720_05685 [Comamonas sp.]|uniref:hypothetical protein n=1 Tax=Comamonas sp. TaxID=34028 RepID=UPI002FCC7DBA